MTETWEISDAARRLHRDALVWDMVWPLEPWCGNDYDKLSLFADAGVNLVSITLAGDNHNVGEAVQRIAAARHDIEQYSSDIHVVETIGDIDHAREHGKLAVSFHLEGTRCFERNLHMVDAFYRLGIRHSLLAFNQTNSAGGGCAEHQDGGLTRFGHQLVEQMNKVGMLIDLSHTGAQTTMDAMEASSKPVVFSHSNSSTVAPHYRNISDAQAIACAALGGVIGISSSNEYLGVQTTTPEAIFRHIDHFVSLLGAESVGLGLDMVFDHEALSAWIRTRPAEWPGAEREDWQGFNYAIPAYFPRLTELLLDHGYPEAAIRGILGDNFRRVCTAVWRSD